MNLPDVVQVEYSATVPVVPSVTVTAESAESGGVLNGWWRVATVGLVAGYYVRAGYAVPPSGRAVLLGWRCERADIAGAEESCIQSALEWCERGQPVKVAGSGVAS